MLANWESWPSHRLLWLLIPYDIVINTSMDEHNQDPYVAIKDLGVEQVPDLQR